MGHTVLQFVKGIAKTPGDTFSSEQGLDSIDLLDTNGFSTDFYEMKIPALKSSAIYADSPLSDGRTLIAGALGNVTETLRVTLTAGTIVQLSAMLSKLLRFKQDCNDYWDTFGQIEPVYIKHQVNDEPGPRYALLYDIDMAIESPTNPSEPTRDLTIVIEREYGWRGIAPGDNPKRWTYYKLEQNYNNTKAALLTGSDHIVTQTIQNRREYNVAGTALVSQNHIDIPAASIPGDLPALVCISAEVGNSPINPINGMFIARTSKPDLLTNAGALRPPNYILNAGDANTVFGTDTSTEADTGAPLSTATGTARHGLCTFATVTADRMRFFWSPGDRGYIDFSILRGRFAVFTRARLSAVGTVALHIKGAISGAEMDTTPVQLSDGGAGTGANTTSWGFVYLGVLSIPFTQDRVSIADDGLGTQVLTTGSTQIIELWAERISGTPSLYVADIIFVPIDECGSFVSVAPNGTFTTGTLMYDNTGYYTHGSAEAFTKRDTVANTTLMGADLTLKPNAINRLHFLLTAFFPSVQRSEIDLTLAVRVDIVPRWSGVRTE